MKSVTILGFQNSMGSTIVGPMDIFYHAGRLWNIIQNQPLTPHFKAQVASVDGKPFRCHNHLYLTPHASLFDIEETDLILIAAQADIDKTLKYCSPALDWLIDQYNRGAHVAGICTGVFFLAETGLLDGKIATTHWGFVSDFKRRYPKVDLKPERMITDDDNLYCSAGHNASLDLALYLVSKFSGHEVAVECSKTVIFDLDRSRQTPYAAFHFQHNHGDDRIREAQHWLEDNFADAPSNRETASRFGMSLRSFERRFKRATGDSPRQYLQSIRVEAAKRMLEDGGESFDEISHRVGYEDASSFRKVFTRLAGLQPRAYQDKFGRNSLAV
jgi:transcriptional regulator GlxA family with amidase domain